MTEWKKCKYKMQNVMSETFELWSKNKRDWDWKKLRMREWRRVKQSRSEWTMKPINQWENASVVYLKMSCCSATYHRSVIVTQLRKQTMCVCVHTSQIEILSVICSSFSFTHTHWDKDSQSLRICMYEIQMRSTYFRNSFLFASLTLE
jgi:hypothetical protein